MNKYILTIALLLTINYDHMSAGTVTISYNYCDKLFSDSHFVAIDREYTKLCNNRFQFLSNKIKRQFINQYENDRRRNTSN